MTRPIETLEDLRNRILVECSGADVGLWWVVADIEEFLGTQDQNQVRQSTLDLLRPLLVGGLIQPFSIQEDGDFSPWTEQPHETLSRIDSEWHSLGHRPQHNEIVWFTATPHGREVIKRNELEGRW